jgi:hypothetical protein
VRPVPASGLSFPLGPGVVTLRPDGSIGAVRADSGSATSWLGAGGRVAVRIAGAEVWWPETSLAADVDEVEFSYLGREDLGLVVRHSFAGGWTVRVAFANNTLEPLTIASELAWVPAATSPAWALAAGATGAYAILGPGGTWPLLGGELILGTSDTVSAESIGLGPFTLDPLGRHVVQWRWNWFDHPQAFHQDRFLDVPRDLVLPASETARIAADDDEAVVAPGVEVARRGGRLEFSPMGPGAVSVQLSSHRGVTRYEIEWAAPLDEVLAEIGERLLRGPRNPAGVVRLADLDVALVVQHLLASGAMGDPDDAEDALGLFESRLVAGAVTDGRGIAFLCGEFERTGEQDLLDRATAALLGLSDPVPGLGLATAQVCVARLSLGWPVEPVLAHLAAVTAASEPGEDLGATAVALEMRLVGAPRAATDAERAEAQAVEAWSTRLGTGLGAGLRGRPVRPLPVDQQAYLATVLGLLRESPGARVRSYWGCRPHDVARRAQAEALTRLGWQPPRAAHSWLILGARLA